MFDVMKTQIFHDERVSRYDVSYLVQQRALKPHSQRLNPSRVLQSLHDEIDPCPASQGRAAYHPDHCHADDQRHDAERGPRPAKQPGDHRSVSDHLFLVQFGSAPSGFATTNGVLEVADINR